MERSLCLALVLASLSLSLTSTAMARGREYPDRFSLKVGAFFVQSAETRASARPSSGLPGTEIEFDRDLNGETGVTVPRVEGYFRFTPRHRIDYGWYDIEREGQTDLGKEITFGDRTLSLGSPVESRIETTIRKLTYSWSFHHSDTLELGASIGVHYPQFSMRLRTAAGSISQKESFDAPLPVWGLLMEHTLADRWHLLARGELFRIKLDGELDGSLTDLQLQTEYRLGRNFALGAGLSCLRMEGDVDNGNFKGELEDLYRGYQLYGAVYF